MDVCNGDSPYSVAVKFCDDHNLERQNSAALLEAIQSHQLQMEQGERLQQQHELQQQQQHHHQQQVGEHSKHYQPRGHEAETITPQPHVSATGDTDEVEGGSGINPNEYVQPLLHTFEEDDFGFSVLGNAPSVLVSGIAEEVEKHFMFKWCYQNYQNVLQGRVLTTNMRTFTTYDSRLSFHQ
jgi:hypothetical protein